MKRKLLAFLLAVSMIVSMSAVAMAEETASQDNTVDITMTLSYGYIDEDDVLYGSFLSNPITGELIASKEIEVPYFDLGLYGLEKYYYNPACYDTFFDTEEGGPKGGTKESAEGHVTVLHALIYATEVIYCNIEPECAGQGYLKNEGLLGPAVQDKGGNIISSPTYFSWQEQQAGSFFMLNFWERETGGSLMYYVNDQYPIGCEGTNTWGQNVQIGATMDQVELKDGDHISYHIMGAYGDQNYMVYSNAYGRFNVDGETKSITVNKGDSVDVNLMFRSTFDLMMETEYLIEEPLADLEVRYTNSLLNEFDDWGCLDVTTDDNGDFTLDTTGWDEGTYRIAAFVPSDYYPSQYCFEYAPATMIVNVIDPNAPETPEQPSVLYGDANKDGKIDYKDAVMILNYSDNNSSNMDTVAADMNKDGEIDYKDAVMILNYSPAD